MPRFTRPALLAITLATGGLLVAACSKADEPASAPAAERAAKTTEAPATKPAPPPAAAGDDRLAAAAGTYAVDSGHSTIVFRIERMGLSHQFGTFNDVSGTLTIGANASDSTVAIEVATDSVFTANKKRDTHLKSPDFFDAKQFPKITFTSTKIEAAGDGKVNVTGDLSMHGVTKPITIPLEMIGADKDPWGGFRAGFVGTVTIQRSAFDITFMADSLSDDVELTLAVEAIKQ